DATPELKTIYQWARARYAAPWAVFFAVLLRVSASTGPHVQLPGVIGGRASLNLLCAFVAPSGGGKGISDKVARLAWPANIKELPIGSGEGIKVGAGGAGAIAIKTTKTGSVDDAVLDPIPVQDKGRFGALGGGDGSGGTLAGGAAHAGVPGGTGNVFAGGAAGIATGSVSRAQRPAFTITGPLGGRQVIYQEKPEYPAILRAKGIESAVHLRFVVTAEGNVKDVSIVRTSGYPDMDRSAVRALRKWSFVPLDHFEDQEGTIIMTFSLR
ncbi:MAG TPA: energy transducer TonB, partial [Elusimicrobiota bacterium]|nr:energy transducer TonB [Elusimicrobiota bacterium]